MIAVECTILNLVDLSCFRYTMYPLKSKRRFRQISFLLLVLYTLLYLTAGGLHSYDKKAYHGHVSDNHYQESNPSENSKPILCCNDHNTNDCIACQWLKCTSTKAHITQRIKQLGLDVSKLCANNHHIYTHFIFGKDNTRSPPLTIS